MEQILPEILFVFGVGLQFARADRRFKDWAYYTAAVVLAMLGYALTTSLQDQHWKAELAFAIVALKTNVPMVLSGTFITSGLAKAAAARRGGDASHAAIPVTNSK